MEISIRFICDLFIGFLFGFEEENNFNNKLELTKLPSWFHTINEPDQSRKTLTTIFEYIQTYFVFRVSFFLFVSGI